MTTSHTLNNLSLKGMLERLTLLYHDEGWDSQAYNRALQESLRQVHYAFPGLTIVLAEIADRDYLTPVVCKSGFSPAITHVLAPESAETGHKLGWHDVYEVTLALDGTVAIWDIASLEVRRADGTWLAGTVSAGGPASQTYMVTAPSGEIHFLAYGDVVRNVVFRDQKGEVR